MLRKTSTLSILFAMLPAFSSADPCDAIITHGLRNISVAYSDEALVANKYEKACSYDFSSMSDSQVANLEVEVTGYGGGSAGYSRQRSEEKIKSWCDENREVAQSNRKNLQNTQTFYQGAVDAWQSCIALNSKDVLISPRITPDGRTVDISIVYRGPQSDAVVLSGVPANGFKCDVLDQNAAEVKFPVKLTTASVNVHCEREGYEVRKIGEQEFNFLPRGTISIQTASDPFQLFFVEEFSPLAPDSAVARLTTEIARKELPVGSIVASVLQPEKFLMANGPYEVGKWMVADGSQLPAGSKYEAITGEKVAPDLRYLTSSQVVTGLVSTPLGSGNQLMSVIPADVTADSWVWFASARDVSGNRANNDYEQDVDQFQVFIDNDVVTAQGRTLNWKHNVWGQWQQGAANVLGIATKRSGMLYYVKIN